MKIIPAIDLMDGKVVRLYKGDPNQKTVYSDDPVDIAKKWESATLEFSNRKLSNLLKEVWGQGLDYYNSEIKNFKENHI